MSINNETLYWILGALSVIFIAARILHRSGKVWEILGNVNVNFLNARKVAFTASGILCALGVVAIVLAFMGQAKLGIDFAGGISMQLKFEQPVQLDQVRGALAQAGYADAQVQEIQDSNTLFIRLKEVSSVEQGAADTIVATLRKTFPGNTLTIEETTEIGAAIGKELRDKAAYAILFSTLGLLIYIAVRFDLKFGIAAAIATFHDVLVVMGIVWLTGIEISLLIITALLTLAGYSLTDTVVVFDRIRENLKSNRTGTLKTVINSSINQVLSRTIVVSLTTLLVLVALYFLGGRVLQDFAFTLGLGVIVGTYSSIYVASPLLMVWRSRRSRLLGRAR